MVCFMQNSIVHMIFVVEIFLYLPHMVEEMSTMSMAGYKNKWKPAQELELGNRSRAKADCCAFGEKKERIKAWKIMQGNPTQNKCINARMRVLFPLVRGWTWSPIPCSSLFFSLTPVIDMVGEPSIRAKNGRRSPLIEIDGVAEIDRCL